MKLLLLMFLSLATTLAHDPLDYDDYTTDVKATDDGNSTGSLGARGHRQMTGRRDRFNNPSFNPSAIGTSRYGRRRGPTTTTQEVEVKVEQPDSGGCKHISEEMGVLCPNGCSLKTELLKQETNIRGIVRDLKPQVAKLSESSNSIYTRVNHMHNSLRERQRVEDGNVNVMGQYNGRVEDQHNYIKEMVDTFFPSNMRVMQGVLDRIRQKIQKLEKAIRIQMDGCSEPCTTRCPVPVVSGMECEDIFRKGGRESQMYLVRTDPSVMPYRVFCDQTTENGGWLLIQNRLDGSVDFGRRWDAYRSGFGNIAFDVGKGHCETAGEYWLGLDRISDLTKTGQTEVLFEMQDWTGAKVSARYKKFTVQSKLSNFVLAVDEYSGNAGNGLLEGSLQLFGVNRTMTIHNGMMFSTYDRDNDNWNPGDPSKQCSREDGGGWWYNRCHSANPNGRYYIGGEYTSKMAKHGTDDGMVWMNWKGSWYSLKTMSIKIRPVFN